MRTRAFRRHQAQRHMWRRLKEDRNQHYDRLNCLCWSDPKEMARFKEQPQHCSCWGCGNQRRAWGRTYLTRQEIKFLGEPGLSELNAVSEAEFRSFFRHQCA